MTTWSSASMIGGECSAAAAIGAILPPHHLARQGMLGAMHDDDRLIGHLLTRRKALGLLGAGGLAATLSPEGRGQGEGRAAAAEPGTCVARPALTEGPYFVDAKLDRS